MQEHEATLTACKLPDLLSRLALCLDAREHGQRNPMTWDCSQGSLKPIAKVAHLLLICIAMVAETVLDVHFVQLVWWPLNATQAADAAFLREHLPTFSSFSTELPVPTNGIFADFVLRQPNGNFFTYSNYSCLEPVRCGDTDMELFKNVEGHHVCTGVENGTVLLPDRSGQCLAGAGSASPQLHQRGVQFHVLPNGTVVSGAEGEHDTFNSSSIAFHLNTTWYPGLTWVSTAGPMGEGASPVVFESILLNASAAFAAIDEGGVHDGCSRPANFFGESGELNFLIESKRERQIDPMQWQTMRNVLDAGERFDDRYKEFGSFFCAALSTRDSCNDFNLTNIPLPEDLSLVPEVVNTSNLDTRYRCEWNTTAEECSIASLTYEQYVFFATQYCGGFGSSACTLPSLMVPCLPNSLFTSNNATTAVANSNTTSAGFFAPSRAHFECVPNLDLGLEIPAILQPLKALGSAELTSMVEQFCLFPATSAARSTTAFPVNTTTQATETTSVLGPQFNFSLLDRVVVDCVDFFAQLQYIEQIDPSVLKTPHTVWYAADYGYRNLSMRTTTAGQSQLVWHSDSGDEPVVTSSASDGYGMDNAVNIQALQTCLLPTVSFETEAQGLIAVAGFGAVLAIAYFGLTMMLAYLTICRCAHTGNADAVRALKLYGHAVSRQVAIDCAQRHLIQREQAIVAAAKARARRKRFEERLANGEIVLDQKIKKKRSTRVQHVPDDASNLESNEDDFRHAAKTKTLKRSFTDRELDSARIEEPDSDELTDSESEEDDAHLKHTACKQDVFEGLMVRQKAQQPTQGARFSRSKLQNVRQAQRMLDAQLARRCLRLLGTTYALLAFGRVAVYLSIVAVLRCFLAPTEQLNAGGWGFPSSTSSHVWSEWSPVFVHDARWFFWPSAVLEDEFMFENVVSNYSGGKTSDFPTTIVSIAGNSTVTSSSANYQEPESSHDVELVSNDFVQYLWAAVVLVMSNQLRLQWGDAALLALFNSDVNKSGCKKAPCCRLTASIVIRLLVALLGVVVPVILWPLPLVSAIAAAEIRYIGNAAAGMAAKVWWNAPYAMHGVLVAAAVSTLWLMGPVRGAMIEVCRRSMQHTRKALSLDISTLVKNAAFNAGKTRTVKRLLRKEATSAGLMNTRVMELMDEASLREHESSVSGTTASLSYSDSSALLSTRSSYSSVACPSSTASSTRAPTRVNSRVSPEQDFDFLRHGEPVASIVTNDSADADDEIEENDLNKNANFEGVDRAVHSESTVTSNSTAQPMRKVDTPVEEQTASTKESAHLQAFQPTVSPAEAVESEAVNLVVGKPARRDAAVPNGLEKHDSTISEPTHPQENLTSAKPRKLLCVKKPPKEKETAGLWVDAAELAVEGINQPKSLFQRARARLFGNYGGTDVMFAEDVFISEPVVRTPFSKTIEIEIPEDAETARKQESKRCAFIATMLVAPNDVSLSQLSAVAATSKSDAAPTSLMFLLLQVSAYCCLFDCAIFFVTEVSQTLKKINVV
eukprot:INCI3640.2.p1 GENE.INCI3640.2~~INCI3640.2.p1  ORF type:complete len:1502 (+),score=228.05 INCI3640.2:1045-5550(+)